MQVDARDVILGLTAELNDLRGKIHTQYVKEDIQLTGGRAEMVREAEVAFFEGVPQELPLVEEVRCPDLDTWLRTLKSSQLQAGLNMAPHSYDNPMARTLGFVDLVQRKHFYISLTALKGTIIAPEVANLFGMSVGELRQMFNTPGGRSELVSGGVDGYFNDGAPAPSSDRGLEALQRAWEVEAEQEKFTDMGEIPWARPHATCTRVTA